jgi:ABC-type uncharacterized transport system ATPase subunit
MPLLRAENITKVYPDVVANDGITFEVERGEVHALLGENGAGKSTLMNILYGLVHPDEGRIFWNDKLVHLRHTREAMRLGIGMVHQHFNLVPCFSAVENVALQMHGHRSAWLTTTALRKSLESLCSAFSLRVDLNVPVQELSLGSQQRVELLKALVAKAKLLILDEPTAVLAPPEVAELFALLRGFVTDGGAVLLITHKLREVKEVSDRVSILRTGKLIATAKTGELSEEEMVTLMVGRPVDLTVRDARIARQTSGETALHVENLHVRADSDREGLHGVSLTVHSGEIVGVAAVEGNGQTALFETICGIRPPESGKIWILRKDRTEAEPAQLQRVSIGRIPEDRQTTGLLLDMPVSDNLILRGYNRPPLSRFGWQRKKEIRTLTERLFRSYDIRSPNLKIAARKLSGGNQQKIVLARELHGQPLLLVVSNPVRGLDIGATEYVYRQLELQRSQGAAILLISSDLEEILTLSDRVAVLYRGKLMGVVSADDSNRNLIGLMMSGIRG